VDQLDPVSREAVLADPIGGLAGDVRITLEARSNANPAASAVSRACFQSSLIPKCAVSSVTS